MENVELNGIKPPNTFWRLITHPRVLIAIERFRLDPLHRPQIIKDRALQLINMRQPSSSDLASHLLGCYSCEALRLYTKSQTNEQSEPPTVQDLAFIRQLRHATKSPSITS